MLNLLQREKIENISIGCLGQKHFDNKIMKGVGIGSKPQFSLVSGGSCGVADGWNGTLAELNLRLERIQILFFGGHNSGRFDYLVARLFGFNVDWF